MQEQGPYRVEPPACPNCDKTKTLIWNLEEDKKVLEGQVARYKEQESRRGRPIQTVVGLFRTVLVALVFMSIYWTGVGLLLERINQKTILGNGAAIFLVLFSLAISLGTLALTIAYEVKQNRYYGAL